MTWTRLGFDRLTRFLRRRILSGMRTCLWAVIAGIVVWAWQPARAGSPSYVPAWVDPGTKPLQLILFPLDGPEIAVSLPAELSPMLWVLASGPDGRTIYAQKPDPLNHSIGIYSIYKIEFQPTRANVIRGSVGTGQVDCLTVSPSSGKIIVEGWSWSFNSRGVFEMDPDTGTIRPLPVGSPSVCGGTGGLLSPDGKHVVRKNGKKLDLVNVETGASRVVKGVSADMGCVWSPNAQRIACVRDGEIAVVDAADPSRRRSFGVTSYRSIEWSPDSKYLLRRTPQLSCILTVDFESLEVLDVETGKRRAVKSSHCRISTGAYGWIDSTVATK